MLSPSFSSPVLSEKKKIYQTFRRYTKHLHVRPVWPNVHTLQSLFSTLLLVFGSVVKYGVSCIIYYFEDSLITQENHNREGVLDSWSLAQILILCVLISFSFEWQDISNKQESVSSVIQTPQNLSKILCCVSYFPNSSQGLDMQMKHCLLCLIFYIKIRHTTLKYN